jgi:hypothetical protein
MQNFNIHLRRAFARYYWQMGKVQVLAKDRAEAEKRLALVLQNGPGQIQWQTHPSAVAKAGPHVIVLIQADDEVGIESSKCQGG